MLVHHLRPTNAQYSHLGSWGRDPDRRPGMDLWAGTLARTFDAQHALVDQGRQLREQAGPEQAGRAQVGGDTKLSEPGIPPEMKPAPEARL